MTEPITVVFLGTPDFSCPFLEKLAQDSRFKLLAVITQENKPVGRKKILTAPPIKILAQNLNIPVFQPIKLNKDHQVLDLLARWQPDFLVVVAFGQILSRKVLALPRIKPINIHGSVLPKYRGASPIEQAIMNGDDFTGLSIMEMVKEMDAGPVYSILDHPIAHDDNSESLRKKLSKYGANALPDILVKIKKGELKAQPQDEKAATYCQKISKEDGLISPEFETAQQVYNKFRAYTPWPGIFIKLHGKSLKLLEISLNDSMRLLAGQILADKKNLFLGCQKGVIQVKKLQLEGKTAQTTEIFLSGNKQLFS